MTVEVAKASVTYVEASKLIVAGYTMKVFNVIEGVGITKVLQSFVNPIKKLPELSKWK